MINLKDCIELGVLIKTHGIKGHLIMKLNDISFDEINTMESVFIIIDALPVPFFIDDFYEKDIYSAIIKFEEITSSENAKVLVNNTVYIEKKFLSKKSSGLIKSYSGYSVIDSKAGVIGKLNEIIDFEKNPMMQIIQNNKEILLPLQLEFILNVDEKKKIIFVSCPDGLLDIYL